MRCNKCANCIKLESEKRLALMAAQPYHLVRGRLQVNTNPPDFDNEVWNKTLASLPCYEELPYLWVSQVKVGDVLVQHNVLDWKHWEGEGKPLTVIKKGGRTSSFILAHEGREYKANGMTLTCYSHNVIVRDGLAIGKFYCKYW